VVIYYICFETICRSKLQGVHCTDVSKKITCECRIVTWKYVKLGVGIL